MYGTCCEYEYTLLVCMHNAVHNVDGVMLVSTAVITLQDHS